MDDEGRVLGLDFALSEMQYGDGWTDASEGTSHVTHETCKLFLQSVVSLIQHLIHAPTIISRFDAHCTCDWDLYRLLFPYPFLQNIEEVAFL
jgi:hypothetical protein